MKSLLIALQFLTIFPWPRVNITDPAIGKATRFFPVVGICLGLLLTFVNHVLYSHFGPETLSVLLVTFWIIMTGALHLDGLGDTFDGLGAKGSREDALRAMNDSYTGVFGLTAVLVVLSLKFFTVASLGGMIRDKALLLAPVMGRWAMVLLAVGSKPAHEGLGQLVVDHVKGRELLFATTVAFPLMVVLSGRRGLWSMLGVSVFTVLARWYLHRQIGGLTGDTFGAVGELAETFTLLAFAFN